MTYEKYHAIYHMSYRDGSDQGGNYVCYSKDLELLKKVLENKIKKNIHKDIESGEYENTVVVENTETGFIYENDTWRYEYYISENVKLRIVEESDLTNEDFMENHIFFDTHEQEEEF